MRFAVRPVRSDLWPLTASTHAGIRMLAGMSPVCPPPSPACTQMRSMPFSLPIAFPLTLIPILVPVPLALAVVLPVIAQQRGPGWQSVLARYELETIKRLWRETKSAPMGAYMGDARSMGQGGPGGGDR
jgi:hypothetical protein